MHDDAPISERDASMTVALSLAGIGTPGNGGRPINTRITFDADNHLATLALSLRPGTYQLVVTTGLTDINGVTMADEYHASLVISR